MALLLVLLFTAGASGDRTDNWVGIRRAWNGNLSDGELTYRILGGEETAQAAVRSAVEEWEAAGLALTEVSGEHNKADINIRFEQRRGVVAGRALVQLDARGFIKSVHLAIYSSGLGSFDNSATIAHITRHEIGHALGISHANFGDLMAPANSSVTRIRECDVEAVRHANRWKLVKGVSTPQHPQVGHISCTADGSFDSLPLPIPPLGVIFSEAPLGPDMTSPRRVRITDIFPDPDGPGIDRPRLPSEVTRDPAFSKPPIGNWIY